MVKGLFAVSFASAAGVACIFLRGVLLARLLGPEQFGISVILVSIAAALDMFADAGIDKYIVRSRFGYRRDVVRTSHAYRVGGSLLVAVAIALLARPLALLFDEPDIWPAIALTGGVVALRGFVNLDYKLEQRERRFGAEATIDTLRFVMDLVVAAAVALATMSYWAVVAAVYANALVHLLASHLYRRSPYSFRPRDRLVGLIGRFSVPVYTNAVLLLAAGQGDRFVIAALFNSRDLAFYAVANAIGQGIVAQCNKVTTSMMLPLLAPHGASHEVQRRTATRLGATTVFGSVLFGIAMAAAGPAAVRLIYGPEYGGLAAIITASAIAQMIQIEQGWLTTLLMAHGLTRWFPFITIMKAAAFPAAILLVWSGLSLIAIPLAFALGSAASLIVSYAASRHLRLIDRKVIVLSFARIIFVTAGTLLFFT